MIPYNIVHNALHGIAENVDTEERMDGIAFRHGRNKGRPFDFAILKKTGTNEAFVRLTRFRVTTGPKQPLRNTSEAVQIPIRNDDDLRVILCLARYSLSLTRWITVNSTSHLELAKSFCDKSNFPR